MLTEKDKNNIRNVVDQILKDEGVSAVEAFYFRPETFKIHAYAREYLRSLGAPLLLSASPGRGGRRSGSGRKPSVDTVKRKSFSVSIPLNLYSEIQKYIECHDCSVNQYIIDSIKLKQNKKSLAVHLMPAF